MTTLAIALCALTAATALPSGAPPRAPGAPSSTQPSLAAGTSWDGGTSETRGRAALLVRATGFTDADAAKLVDKVSAEVAGRGFEVVRIADADAACWTARPCARDMVRGANAIIAVRVDLVRGGGNVQIAGTVVDVDGRASEEATGIARLATLLGGGAVLPPALAAMLVAAPPSSTETSPAVAAAPLEAARPDAAPTATTPSTTPSTARSTPSTTPAPTERAAPHEATAGSEAPADAPLSGTALAAIGGVGVGALAVAVGVVGATGQLGVARDPQALGTDKERAAVLVPVLVGVSIAGAALAGVSGWLLLGELGP